jgi:hypothetical protein
MLSAQKYRTEEIRIDIEDSLILVHLELNTKEPIDLGMFCLKDSSHIWIFCKTISGDIENQISGNKTIIWYFLQDGFLYDDLIQSELVFRIREVEPYIIQRTIDEKARAKQLTKEKKASAREKAKAEGQIANENLNGHYIVLGSSFTSSGCYGGIVGVSYEYRYGIWGMNISIGRGSNKKNFAGFYNALNVITGLKIYLAHKKKMIRNFYFNFLPFCYFGQDETHIVNYFTGNNLNIIRKDDYRYKHLWGVGVFAGYSPIWHINKRIALGFNINAGVKANYRFNKWRYLNWDLGFIIKF